MGPGLNRTLPGPWISSVTANTDKGLGPSPANLVIAKSKILQAVGRPFTDGVPRRHELGWRVGGTGYHPVPIVLRAWAAGRSACVGVEQNLWKIRLARERFAIVEGCSSLVARER